MSRLFYAAVFAAALSLAADDNEVKSVALSDPENSGVQAVAGKSALAITRDALAKVQPALGHAEATVVVEILVNGQPQQPQEQRAKLPVTFIASSGLAMGTLPNPKAGKTPNGQEVKFNTSLKDINLLVDGLEIPARLILKDEETGIAFFAPLKPVDKPVPFVDAAKGGGEPAVLDEVYLQIRTDERMFNTVVTQATRVTGAVSAPRKLWLISGGAPSGVLVFGGSGLPVGVIAEQSGVPVILPMSKLGKLVAQALAEAAKPAETAPVEAKAAVAKP